MIEPEPRSRYAVPADELEAGARIPFAAQVASVDPDRGATQTSSADWLDTLWLADGGHGGSMGAGLAADGDGD